MLKRTPFLSRKQRKGLTLFQDSDPRHRCAGFHQHDGWAEAENDRSPLHHWNGCINAPEGVLADATVFTNRQEDVRRRHAPSDRQQQLGSEDADCSWPKLTAGLSHSRISLGVSRCVKRRKMLPRVSSSSHRSGLLLVADRTTPTQQQHQLRLRSERGGRVD